MCDNSAIYVRDNHVRTYLKLLFLLLKIVLLKFYIFIYLLHKRTCNLAFLLVEGHGLKNFYKNNDGNNYFSYLEIIRVHFINIMCALLTNNYVVHNLFIFI